MCRSFFSKENCGEENTAIIDELDLAINTVTQQIIEHLSQNGYWGNMLDVLLAMAEEKRNDQVKKLIKNREAITKAKKNTLIAEAIPGFLLKPEEREKVSCYLQTIFSEQLGSKTVQELLFNS